MSWLVVVMCVCLFYLIVALIYLGYDWIREYKSKLSLLRMVRYTRRKEVLGSSIGIWIDEAFDSNERLAIKMAIAHWNVALNGNIVLDEYGAIKWCIRKTNKEELGWLYESWKKRLDLVDILGFVDKVFGSDIYLVSGVIDLEEVFGVTMHEIGHLLGVEHLEEGLMHKTFRKERGQGIGKEVMLEVCRIWGFDLEEVNWMI